MPAPVSGESYPMTGSDRITVELSVYGTKCHFGLRR